MDGIDGDELDAQELLDKMAEVGVIEEGITVDKFEQKDGALTLDLSSLKESSDKLVVMAIANTFIQNYEAKTLELRCWNSYSWCDSSFTIVISCGFTNLVTIFAKISSIL